MAWQIRKVRIQAILSDSLLHGEAFSPKAFDHIRHIILWPRGNDLVFRFRCPVNEHAQGYVRINH